MLQKQIETKFLIGMVLTIIVTLMLLFIFFGCGGGSDSSNAEVNEDNNDTDEKDISFEITGLDWLLLNMETPEGPSCHYNFQINYKGDDLNGEDIESIRFYIGKTDQYWQYEPNDTALYDTQNKIIGKSVNFSGLEDGDVLPLGNMTARIALFNGTTYELAQAIPGPSEAIAGHYDYTYTENYSGTAPDNYIPMLRRALARDSSYISNSSFTIYFDIEDERAYNVKVLFYSDTEYVGESDFLIDFKTGEIADFLNNGAGLDIYDSSIGGYGRNIVFIPDEEINFTEQYSSADVARFAIYLTDRIQDPANPETNTYRCASISEKVTISK